jgi:ABC-2 type transport system permease protein
MIFISRIYALVVKEILTMFRDKKSRVILIAPPLIMLLVFSFAATLEVKNATLVVFNQDMGHHGFELVERLQGSPMFSGIKTIYTQKAIKPAIDNQEGIAAISIPADFSRKLEGGERASVQVILDGRRSNAAQIVNGYITQITADYESELRGAPTSSTLQMETRNWYNANLLYMWFTVPSLVGILGLLLSVSITALSVARERELGTFDQLLVSPLMHYEILIGKTIPAIIVGVSESLLIFFVGTFLFDVPFEGSFLALVFSIVLFVSSVVGIGLFISALSKTQQQAILGSFVVMVPAISLSGYAAPVENMPTWLQYCVWADPLKHFLIIVKGLFLKDMPWGDVWMNAWPLLIIGAITLSVAGWLFSQRLE